MATLCANINKNLGGYGTNATSLSNAIDIVNSHGSTKTVTLFIRYKTGAHAQFTPVVARASNNTFLWIHQNGAPNENEVGVPAALGKFDVNHNVGSTIYYAPNHHQAGSDGWVRVDRAGVGMSAGGIVTVVAEFAVASGTTSIKVGAVLNHNGDYNYSGTNQHELIDITNCDGMIDVMGSSSYTVTVNRSVIDNATGGRNGDRMRFTATAPGTLTWNLGDGTTATTTGTHSVTHTYLNQSTPAGSKVTVTAGSGGIEQVYNTPGTYTYTVPTGITELLVLCAGGGGGGGGGYDNGGPGGPGGGSGGHVIKSVAVNGGDKYTVVVGAGGSRGSGGTYNKKGGSNGGVSRFYKQGSGSSSLLWANGGKGGTSWTAGGLGGTASTGGITGEAGGPGWYSGNISRNGGGGDIMISQTYASSVGMTLKNAGGCSGYGSYGGNEGYSNTGGTCNWSGTNHAGNQVGLYGGGGAGGTGDGGNGGSGVVAVFVGGGSASLSFDFNFIAMDAPDMSEVLKVLPYTAAGFTATNQQATSNRSLAWYITSRNNGFGSAATVGSGYTPSLSQYANGSTKYGLVDGSYDIMVKDTGANIWAVHQMQVGASPTVNITNLANDDVITTDKQIQGEATNSAGGFINDSIQWSLKLAGTSTVVHTHTGSSYVPNVNATGQDRAGQKFDVHATVTSNSQTVTTKKTNVTINRAVQPDSDINTDTLILHPTQKNTGRVLWDGKWQSLFDDSGSGKRRGYNFALGGGIITGSSEVRLGLPVTNTGSSLYNANVKNINTVKEVYNYYKDYIYSHSGDGQAWDGTTWPKHTKNFSGQTSKNFSMAECVKATLAAFSVKVKNDTSGTTYSTDGNGTVTIYVNMGTGSFDVTINGNTKTGMTNNTSHSVGSIEGGTEVQCAVKAKYGNTEVTKSTFKVTIGRDGGGWSCYYKSTTFSGSNNIPMFFYSGTEPPGNHENASYGSPV